MLNWSRGLFVHVPVYSPHWDVLDVFSRKIDVETSEDSRFHHDFHIISDTQGLQAGWGTFWKKFLKIKKNSSQSPPSNPKTPSNVVFSITFLSLPLYK